MVKAGYFQNDNVVIPDNIKNMTREEKKAEIARFEEKSKKERNRLKHERELATV